MRRIADFHPAQSGAGLIHADNIENNMSNPSLDELLEPIPGDDICGVDLSYSTEFDEIREARRHDDPSLAQGEWETERKVANWPRVKELTQEILLARSKDLQAAAWYAEALTRQQGFAGLALGLRVLEGLLAHFWEFCYPAFDPDDLEERASKLEWLNRQMPLVVRDIPITDRGSGGYSWLKWKESRAIDNLGLKDPVAKEKAVQDGKITGEIFDKAVQTSGRGYYEKLHQQIVEAVDAMGALEKQVDERFGMDAPGLKDLRQSILACEELVGKLIARLGGSVANAGNGESQDRQGSAAIPVASAQNAASHAVGVIYNRRDAVNALREVARYFRQHEPHSPVALLAERAANWAEMPLEKWLESVIKDDGTLSQLKELLDIQNR